MSNKNTFNFNTIPKKLLEITLPDEKQTRLFLKTPKKSLMDRIKVFTESKDDSDLYILTADILSNNKTGAVIEPEYLYDLLDEEDMILFIESYYDFIGSIGNKISKN